MSDTAVQLHALDWAAIGAYFVLIVTVGVWVGKFTTTTQDFFFAGQRFSWWLIAFSCVATLVGAYSFVQYSESSYKYGFALLMPYMNEWFVLPVFLAGWLPIIYYNRIQSIPEYFERRFDRRTRIVVLIVLMLYLEVYIGTNLLAIGRVLDGLFDLERLIPPSGGIDWGLIVSAGVVAVVSGLYLHAGGQTSVLITDLIQGVLLLSVGLAVCVLGINYLGGFERFWSGLPFEHRLPFAPFNHPPEYHAAGDFWNDAMVGTFGFWIINQGVLMRFLSAKSVADGRKAMLVVVVVLMPLAAIAVSVPGLVGRSMVSHDIKLSRPPGAALAGDETVESAEPSDDEIAKNIFVLVSSTICRPGIFGLVIAAVIAALMSTLDTLITAVSAIAVNDVFREFVPGRDDAYYLKAARRSAIVVTALGLGLIPILDSFTTIYQALSAFTSLILPPLVVVICLGISTRRFSSRAAFWTLVLGSAAMVASLRWPEMITYSGLSHGVDASEGYPFLRGLFGLVATSIVAVLYMLYESVFPFAESKQASDGLLINSLDHARRLFKGGTPNDRGIGRKVTLTFRVDSDQPYDIRLPRATMDALEAGEGDLLFVSDARWWLGGFRAAHFKAGPATESGDKAVINAEAFDKCHLLADKPITVEKTM